MEAITLANKRRNIADPLAIHSHLNAVDCSRSAVSSTSASGAGPDYTPCAFACLDTPEQTAGKTTLRCVAP